MTLPKRIIVTGATGLIGRALCRQLIKRGDQVVVFTQNTLAARRTLRGATEYVAWSPAETGPWANAVPGAHAIIHLAGAPVLGKRWSAAYKQTLRDSRIIGTRGLVNAIGRAMVKPKVFVSGSAVGYYGPRDDTPLDEDAPHGDDFLAQLCVDWEAEARKAESSRTRVVMLRTGIVLDRHKGALPLAALPFKLFGGGPVASGKQWFPWIHIDDEVGIILKALDDDRVRGAVNVVAPNPQTNEEWSKTLAAALHRPSWLRVPKFALDIALGEAASSLTTGQRVVPAKMQELGYEWKYATSAAALGDLFTKK